MVVTSTHDDNDFRAFVVLFFRSIRFSIPILDDDSNDQMIFETNHSPSLKRNFYAFDLSLRTFVVVVVVASLLRRTARRAFCWKRKKRERGDVVSSAATLL